MLPHDDLSEFRRVFEEEFGYITRALRRLGIRAADLEDLAQDVFVTAHGKFSQFDKARPIRPWLLAFAYRIAANYKRLSRHTSELLGDAASDDVAQAVDIASPEEAFSQRQKQELVLAALERVPLERRIVLVMHDIDGFSAPDIAETLSIPINTVSSRVRVAREEFRRAIQRLQPRRSDS